MNIFVTGIAGFLGGHIAENLISEGHTVSGCDNLIGGYIENVPENADAVRAIRKLAASGHDLIFTTSFNYMDQTLEVAKEFPNVKFEHATGYMRAENVSTYSSRFCY